MPLAEGKRRLMENLVGTAMDVGSYRQPGRVMGYEYQPCMRRRRAALRRAKCSVAAYRLERVKDSESRPRIAIPRDCEGASRIMPWLDIVNAPFSFPTYRLAPRQSPGEAFRPLPYQGLYFVLYSVL